MIATPRSHYEEIDWLDYVQGDTEGHFREDLEAHLAVCATCRPIVKSLERLARSLPVALHLVENETEPAPNEPILAMALERAGRDRSEGDTLEKTLLIAFDGRLAPPAGFRWSPELLEEAHSLCRALLRTDVGTAARILRHAFAFLDRADAPVSPFLRASLRTSFAFIRMTEGAVDEALDILAEVRSVLENDAPVPEIEIAFWHYIRSAALRNASRLEESLLEIRASRALYEVLEDSNRLARCRQAEAVLLSELGSPDMAIGVYEELISETSPGDDVALHARLMTNYGTDLVRSGRLSEAKATYARALDLLKIAGLQKVAFRVRAGLAEIAEREGRLEDALALKIALRTDFKSNSIVWEEVYQELGIAELLIKLGRVSEAAAICRALVPLTERHGFALEAAKALEYLGEAERELDLARLGRVVQFVRRLESGEDARWSAA